MAFNLNIPEVKQPTGDVALKLNRYEYYIEWWKLGTAETDIEAGQFRTANLKHFINVFKSYKYLSLVFLKRCHDDRVLLDRRTGSRQV
jgi:hypothetical protein